MNLLQQTHTGDLRLVGDSRAENLTVAGNLWIEGSLEVNGDLRVSGHVKIEGYLTCGGTVTIEGRLVVQESVRTRELHTNNRVEIHNCLMAEGSVSCAALWVRGGMDVKGDITVVRQIVCRDTLLCAGKVTSQTAHIECKTLKTNKAEAVNIVCEYLTAKEVKASEEIHVAAARP